MYVGVCACAGGGVKVCWVGKEDPGVCVIVCVCVFASLVPFTLSCLCFCLETRWHVETAKQQCSGE